MANIYKGGRVLFRTGMDYWAQADEAAQNRVEPVAAPETAKDRAERIRLERSMAEFDRAEADTPVQARSRDCYDLSRETPSRSFMKRKAAPKSRMVPTDHYVRKGSGNWQRRPHS